MFLVIVQSDRHPEYIFVFQSNRTVRQTPEYIYVFRVIVQSDRHPEYLDTRIEEYLGNVKEKLEVKSFYLQYFPLIITGINLIFTSIVKICRILLLRIRMKEKFFFIVDLINIFGLSIFLQHKRIQNRGIYI